jgi:selenocysteine-specific elongation factor
MLVHPGDYQTTTMIDVFCKILPDAGAPLKHNAEVKLFIGAAEVMARVRLLGVQECPPGGEAFLQLMLQKPLVALRGDRFIIRRPSPPATIGGGQVVDPHPTRRHRRFNADRLEALEQLLMGTPEDIVLQTALKTGPSSVKKIIELSGLEADQAQHAVDVLIEQGALIVFGAGRMILPQVSFSRLTENIVANLQDYHLRFPLRIGMPRERLKSQMALEPKDFDSIIANLVDAGILVGTGADLWLSQHKVRFSPEQQVEIDDLLREFESQPYTPPSYKQSSEMVSEELLAALIAVKKLVRIGEEVLLLPQVFEEMRQAVITHIQKNGSITLAELRDQFDTSRKYAVAVLEYLDQTGVTIRRGDTRVLTKKT